MDQRLFIRVFMPLRGATLDEVFPLNKGGGAKRRWSRSARGLSGWPSQTCDDNPLKASRPREIFSRFHLRLPSPFLKGDSQWIYPVAY